MNTQATEETSETGILQQIAEALGEGWMASSYQEGGADGHLTGPGGEALSVDARAFGEYGNIGQKLFVYLKRRLYEGEVPSIDGTRQEGESLASFMESVRALVPAWVEAHKADLARCAEILAPAGAFAAEVAQFMGEGWSGGAEDSPQDRDRFRPVAFVMKGVLRVEWQPLVYDYGRSWEGVPGSWNPVGRLCLRGDRDKWPDSVWSQNPEITVSAKQPAKRVAGEITRRLLPGYIAAMEAADEEESRHSQAVEGAAATVALVEKLAANLRPYAPDYNEDRTSESVTLGLSADCGGLRLHGKVTCDAHGAYLELHTGRMDAKATKTILGALAKAAEKLTPEE